jgi:hypothetical protein
MVYHYGLNIGWNSVPQGTIVHIGSRLRRLTIWIEIDTDDAIDKSRSLYVAGTGQPLPALGPHIGSTWVDDLMWHVYQDVQ